MPHLYSVPEDVLLPTKIITPPRGSSSPSPPTSGFPEFIPDDLETMGARSSSCLTHTNEYEDEEMDFTQMFQEGSSKRRDAQPLGSSSTVTEDREYDGDAENRKPSKYNVKPPARKASVPVAITTPTPSASASVRRSSARETLTPSKEATSKPINYSSDRSYGRNGLNHRSVPRAASNEIETPSDSDAAPEEIDANGENTKADACNPPTVPRSLRKRALRQTHPFKYDKHQHNMTVKTGKIANTKNVEKAIKEEIEETPLQPAKKKVRTAGNKVATLAKTKAEPDSLHEQESSKNERLSPAVSIDAFDTSPPATEQQFDPSRAILRVRLNDFAGGAATPIALSDCDNNSKLINFINKTWEFSFGDRKFAYAIASFPWLTEASNILLRPGLAESFSGMVAEIENAPMWTEGNHARCHVEVTIYVQ